MLRSDSKEVRDGGELFRCTGEGEWGIGSGTGVGLRRRSRSERSRSRCWSCSGRTNGSSKGSEYVGLAYECGAGGDKKAVGIVVRVRLEK